MHDPTTARAISRMIGHKSQVPLKMHSSDDDRGSQQRDERSYGASRALLRNMRKIKATMNGVVRVKMTVGPGQSQSRNR
jgi:hypothetical protein